MACQPEISTDPSVLMHLPSRVIQASFHQGNEKFGSTKGIQCSCISLFTITFSAFKNVARWNCHDLEYVIEQGDALYKTTGRTDFLACTDLPKDLLIENVPVRVDFLPHASYFGFLHRGTNCLSEIIGNLSENHDHTGILFFCRGYTFSILNLNGSGFIFIVDSHSRNSLGERKY